MEQTGLKLLWRQRATETEDLSSGQLFPTHRLAIWTSGTYEMACSGQYDR